GYLSVSWRSAGCGRATSGQATRPGGTTMEQATTATIVPPPRPVELPLTGTATFSTAAAQAGSISASGTEASGLLKPTVSSPEGTEIVVPRFTPRIREALQLLADASACAQDVEADVWQFSVELSALRRAGLTTNECRWLV